MAISDTATLVVGAGNYFTATVGTAIPTNLSAPGASWTNVGNTSIEDIFAMSSEGGDATTLATLQNAALRTRYSTRVETLQFTLQQFDAESLKLYYGSNAVIAAGPPATVAPNTTPQPTTKAFLAVFVDGSNTFALYAPKAEIFRADDISVADTESLAGLPIGVKFLQNSTNNWTYSITSLT